MQVIGSAVAAGHQHPRRRLPRLRQQRLLQQQRQRRPLQRLQDLLQHPGRVRLHTRARVRQWCDNWRLIDASVIQVFVANVNAMLLNEFLKEHRKVEELSSTVATKLATIADLKSTVAQQQKGMEVLTARLNEQAAQIQKVSAQLEASKPTPQVTENNQQRLRAQRSGPLEP